MATPDLTAASAADRIAQAVREGYADLDARGPDRINEAATRSVLIDRVLEALGYPPSHRSPENADRGDRPDELCYLQPVGRAPGHPALVLEAKRLATDFDRVPAGAARAHSPDRQIQRYLENNRISGPGTIGVLTDGLKWRLYRRAGPAARDVQYAANFNFARLTDPAQTGPEAIPDDDRRRLDEFIRHLSRQAIAANTVPARPEPVNLADRLFDAFAAGDAAPDTILPEILGDPAAVISNQLPHAATLSGVRRDAHNRDWESYALAQGHPLALEQPDLEGGNIMVAAVKFRHQPAREMSRGDVALCARVMAAGAPAANAAVVFAYETAPDGAVSARMAAAAGGQVNMTAAFNPALPRPSARAAIDQQLRLLRDTAAPLNADRLLSPLAVAALRQQFYREVAHWTAGVWQDRDQAGRQAVLRHLIRVMFAWILKEENRIPPEIFEAAFIDHHLANMDDYHRQTLLFLFHHRLNVHYDRREDCPVPGLDAALNDAPFLNGSLFARRPGDDELDLPAERYWSVDPANPGLFTILSRYHWTMDEHRPGESEQTLDPELLSNLFERLIAPAQDAGQSPLRQPQGTYYTPADVADEMVQDALTAAVQDAAAPLDHAGLLRLFGDPDAPAPELPAAAKERLTARIRQLRIFDPAVGSGEFLFSALLALRRALHKLTGAAEPAEAVIRRQLRGQDLNPLAVQIARLRLFIAITAARPGHSAAPLPNLEAVIVCADTLQTVADPQWRAAQLDRADPETGAAVKAVAHNRAQWFAAYDEEAKKELLNNDAQLRANLQMLLQQKGALASPELRQFAQAGLVADAPAQTDARLLFHETPWRGFDIVIGNPPYEALKKSMDRDAVKRLADEKRYRTTGGGDLYNLFCETALALANPNGGVVTLIVPHSISFGQNKRSLRGVFERYCQRINLRNHGNRPDTAFNESPTVQNPENRVQATIITGILGENQKVSIFVTGWQRWLASERSDFLKGRNYAPTPEINRDTMDKSLSHQWPRVPTESIRELIEVINKQKAKIGSYERAGEYTLALPKVAYLFMPTTPWSQDATKDQTPFVLKSQDDLRLIMAVLNGHVAYAWWQAFGDNFHVLKKQLTEMTIPDAWIRDPEAAIDIGQRLIDAIPECTRVTNRMRGNYQHDADFYQKPELIAELDRLHLAALGLPEQPLLRHLRIMRSSSSWNYAAI